jgi:hypothetical protein
MRLSTAHSGCSVRVCQRPRTLPSLSEK